MKTNLIQCIASITSSLVKLLEVIAHNLFDCINNKYYIWSKKWIKVIKFNIVSMYVN